jgi:hypothetical protein
LRPSFTPGADPASPQRLAVYPTTERGDDGTGLEGGDEIVGDFFPGVVLFSAASFAVGSPSSSSTLTVVILALSVVILGLDPRTQARPGETGWLV